MSKPIKRAVIIDFLENLTFTCGNCGSKVKPSFQCRNCKSNLTAKDVHFHHLVPTKLGGTDDLNNIIMLCSKCHLAIDKIRLQKLKHADKKLTSYR